MIISDVKARIIKDSRGADTIAVSVNNCEEASAPNGKSTGDYETPSYYKSLKWCVDFLNAFCDEISVEKFEDLIKVEKTICKNTGLKNAREFGANSLYAFESAVLKALASETGKELWQVVSLKNKKIPFPIGNVVGGGLHSASIPIKPNFQEFLVIPRASRFSDNLKIMQFVYFAVGKRLGVSLVNDEGAWLVACEDENILDALNCVVKEAEKKFKCEIGIGIDAACSTLFHDEVYKYNAKSLKPDMQLAFFEQLVPNYDLFYVEDAFEQRDFKRFASLNKVVGKNCLVVGDDLIATQYNRLVGAIRTRSLNAVIVKPNQNGSLLELKRIFDLCRAHKIKTILSHRSGETLDSALADYAVSFGADFIKCGVATPWREVKLKRLIDIEKRLA